MRPFFRALAVLDFIALFLMGTQLFYISQNYKSLIKTSEQVNAIGLLVMFFLILVGAIGLFLQKKLGFILYYVQFPFRLYLWIFTLGFITLLPEAFELYDEKWFDILLKICFVGEFIRLYLTIRGHINLKQNVRVSVHKSA